MQSGRRLILIDWEGLKLAPVEADWMFLVGKPYYERFLNVYRRSHPNFVLNPLALQFYQSRRKLEDLWEWTEQLLYDKHIAADERTGILKGLAAELKELPL